MKKKKVVHSFGPPPVTSQMPTPQPVNVMDVAAQQYPGQWLSEAAYRGHRSDDIARVQASRERLTVLTRSEEMTALHGTEPQLRARLTELRREVLSMDQMPRTASIDWEFRRRLALIEMVEHRLRDFAPTAPPPPTIQQEIQAIQDAPFLGVPETRRILDGLWAELEQIPGNPRNPGTAHQYTRTRAILTAWQQKLERFNPTAADVPTVRRILDGPRAEHYPGTATEVQVTERHETALRNRFIEDYQSFNQAVLDQAISAAAANGQITQAFFTQPASRLHPPLTQQDVDFYRAGMSATPPPPPRNPPPPLRSLTPLPRAIVRD